MIHREAAGIVFSTLIVLAPKTFALLWANFEDFYTIAVPLVQTVLKLESAFGQNFCFGCNQTRTRLLKWHTMGCRLVCEILEEVLAQLEITGSLCSSAIQRL